MLYRISIAVMIDDPAEVKEALVYKLEEMGFPVGGVLVTVEPVQYQLDYLAAESLRRAHKQNIEE